MKQQSVTAIGGGTGTYTVLSALVNKRINLTALMTMVDDGGSNKVLRDEFGLLPTSGIRLAMVALSRKKSLMQKLFTYRFHQGEGIKGMTFGNLFMAAMADIHGSQDRAIQETASFLEVKGKILPISYNDVQLVATYQNGDKVIGEHMIDEPKHDGTLRITKLETQPEAVISRKSKQAILDSDMIILGPGDFYTNTIANLIVIGACEAIIKSKAVVVFCINLMTKYGEAYNYKASDYLKDLNNYLPLSRLNAILINNDMDFPPSALDQYLDEHSIPVFDDLNSLDLPSHIKIYRTPLVSRDIVPGQKGDILKRSIIRHDTQKLGKALMRLLHLPRKI